jgi:hypothetical protein
VKIGKTRKSDDDAKAMAAYVAQFSSIEDALAFEKAALAAPNIHLPPVARSARDTGQRTALYWRWLDVLAEVWS